MVAVAQATSAVPPPLLPAHDDAIQSLLHLGAEVGDTVSFQMNSGEPDGSPAALCGMAEKGYPAAAAAAAAADRSAAGSPISPEPQFPAGGSGTAGSNPATKILAAAAAAGGSGSMGQQREEEQPAAPPTIANSDALAAAHEAEAVAALAGAADGADGEGESPGAGDDGGRDPEWHARPRGRGRSRKRRPPPPTPPPAPQLSCAHCGTSDTPRWWKDNFPMGTLCNACGIWLKRHGYPRPVQFFLSPLAVAAATTGNAAVAAAQPQPQQAQQAQQQQAGQPALPPPSEEYYLINGRPKRRRGGGGSAGTATAPGGHAAEGVGASAAAAAAADAPIKFEAAGSRVFVIRRKLIKADGGAEPDAALVHFGWAPGARAAHEMYAAVSRFGEGCREASVDDYELLGDCKATATLQRRPGAATPSWDALVRRFVDSL